MPISRRALLVIGAVTIGFALALTFSLLPRLLADMSISDQAEKDHKLIRQTRELPEVREFLDYYPDAKAEVDRDGRNIVKYNFEKQYLDRDFIQIARLYVTIPEENKDSDGDLSSYGVYIDCATTGYDFESNIEGSSMTGYAGYVNVTEFVTDSRCAK